MKYCPKCKTNKNKIEFGRAEGRGDGLRGWCKLCTNAATSQWQKDNPEKMKERKKRFYQNHDGYEKDYYDKNRETIKLRAAAWYAANKEKALANSAAWAKENNAKVLAIKEKWKSANKESVRISDKKYRLENKEQRREYDRKWRMGNIEKARESGRRATAKRLLTPKGKLNSNVSREIRESLKKDVKAGRHWESLVNFTIDQLKDHLEKLFKPGMTWENYGTVWHIDHKIPIAVHNFSKPEDIDFRLCWSLKNLQPLEATKNRSKGAKLEKPFQPSLAVG